MRKLETAQQEHLGQIPQTQLVQQPAEHDLSYDVSWKLQVIERGTGSLIRLASAIATPEDGVAEIGSAVEVPDSGRLAMRTAHKCRAGNSEYRTRRRPFPPTSVLTLSLQSADCARWALACPWREISRDKVLTDHS